MSSGNRHSADEDGGMMCANRLGALIIIGTLTQSAHTQAAKIEEIVKLPIKSMQAVQSDGQILFMSENGRFVITGQLYDIWTKRPLSTLSEMQDAASRIHFKRMGLDVDTLNTVSMGEGPQEVVVFVDPRCVICHQLMHDAKSLKDDYTFKFIVIPALGDESNRLAKVMYCAKDKHDALDALVNNTLDALPAKAPCDSTQYDQTLLTAQLLGIEGVPVVIAPDGRVSQGRPEHLKSWLENL